MGIMWPISSCSAHSKQDKAARFTYIACLYCAVLINSLYLGVSVKKGISYHPCMSVHMSLFKAREPDTEDCKPVPEWLKARTTTHTKACSQM